MAQRGALENGRPASREQSGALGSSHIRNSHKVYYGI